jgi:hypothetical protein
MNEFIKYEVYEDYWCLKSSIQSDLSKFYDGLKNDNGEPLKVNLYKLNGKTVFKENCQYDEIIKFELAKGTYRTFITNNQTELCINFHVP